MITVSITNIFIIYIAAVIFLILILSHAWKRPKKMVVMDKTVVNCPVCAYRYIVSITDKIHRCPQCDSLNT